MEQLKLSGERRTSVDEIFDFLHEEIVSLRLRPGDKISEAEIAARFGVSRQPVRDAFSRLANIDLLLIRPQRATEVKRFSAQAIEKSRFVRAAVEAEVLRRAAVNCDSGWRARLDAALDAQRAAMEAGDFDAFGKLDYAFHQTLCQIAGTEFAFDVISSEKAKVDRLCVLGLSKENRMPDLLQDHHDIAHAVQRGDAEGAVAAAMHHLSRLDSTIAEISASNAGYFDPEPG
ncbi:GntR family transcriptional regulator [Paracoccus sp. Z330]|uniref:GntR family transcriptional regulator n=1 Tax=Paracoccus onchidii TaxID=3017813 RepID=A0ABT4ZFE2_9RHOB|nr:GntR family transcriptional regulator [Paracoccus onchidii]MDB6177436.1 GntR family transcriptional regulator [Paracoccus onchidii]